MKHFKHTSAFLLVFLALLFSDCATTDINNAADPVDKYLGTWQVSDQAARLNYEVSIERNPANSAEILFRNFADLGEAAVGLVVGDRVIIDKQTVSDGYQVEGSGSYIRTSELRFEYELDDGIDIEKRQAVFTK